jgi:subtilase family serine protease
VAAGALVTLSGHVPAAVSQLTAEGSLPGTNRLSLAIGLPLRNTEALSNLLQQVYDPSSTNYHKYLTPDQFTARFGPTAQDYQSVIDFATRNGLVVSGTYSNRMLVDVTGKSVGHSKCFSCCLAHISASDREPGFLCARYGTNCGLIASHSAHQWFG